MKAVVEMRSEEKAELLGGLLISVGDGCVLV